MNSRTVNITQSALFAALISLSAAIRIPIGPVPLTCQTVSVLVTGYYLGPVYGAFATLLYTAVGLAGLPVFASGGGPAYVLSPTFGYIIGFTLCAFITGYLARFNPRKSVGHAYLIMLAGLPGIYIPGILWLSVALNWIGDVPISMSVILRTGLLLPLTFDLITIVPAAFIAVRLTKTGRRTG